jgi:hypothetical protein
MNKLSSIYTPIAKSLSSFSGLNLFDDLIHKFEIKNLFGGELPKKHILQSCSHKFMLRQTITDEKFFTQSELELIQSISSSKGNYSEIYYKSEFHKKVIRYHQNKHEYHLFTSERRDNLRLERFFKELPEELSFQEKFELYLDFADRGINQ